MEEIVSPASKLVGEVVVPGERAPAERALVLAALGAEKSVLRNVPVSADRVVALLRGLGIGIDKKKNTYVVKGGGLRGFMKANSNRCRRIRDRGIAIQMPA